MSIIKLPTSPNYYARFMINGEIKQKSLRTSNKRLAEKMAQQFYEELLAKQHNIGTAEITIANAFVRYAKTKPTDKGIQAGTSFILKWFDEAKIISTSSSISDLTTTILEDIVEVRRNDGRKEGSIRQLIGHISRVIKWAKKNGFAVAEVELPKLKKANARLRYLSVEEEQRLLAELDPLLKTTDSAMTHLENCFQDNYDLCVILLDTGARLSEITTLKWDSVNLKKETISLYRSKVGNESVLFMTQRVKEILKRRANSKGSEFVFTDSKGDFKKGVAGIRRAIKRANLKDCCIHTLRHTAASRLVQSGMQLYEVSHILGHTNVAMSSRYAHLAKTDVSKKARDLLNGKKTDQSSYMTEQLIPETSSLYNSFNKTALESSYIEDLLSGKDKKTELSIKIN